MKRVIKDYKSIEQEHIDLINEHYPNGFENDDLVSFTTPKGQFIKALEIRTGDTIYLFKIDKNMRVDDENQENEGISMSEFDNYKGGDTDDDDMDGDDDEEEEDDKMDEAGDVADDAGDDDED